MKLLSYISICAIAVVIVSCKKSAQSGTVNVAVNSDLTVQTNILVYGSSPNYPTVDTTSAYLNGFNYSFKGLAGQTLVLSVGATGIVKSLITTVTYNGKTLSPYTVSEYPDSVSTSLQLIYQLPN
jgi:hypothetical protein